MATAMCLAFATGMLVSAGGCSGPAETQAPTARDDESQKLLQARIKENQEKAAAAKGRTKK
jgi:hypothetical protein